MSSTSQVGTGSNWHLVLSWWASTSMLVTSLHSVTVGVTHLCGNIITRRRSSRCSNGVDLVMQNHGKVVDRMYITVGRRCVTRPLNVRHSLLESPLLAAILSHKKLVFLSSYRARIDQSNTIYVNPSHRDFAKISRPQPLLVVGQLSSPHHTMASSAWLSDAPWQLGNYDPVVPSTTDSWTMEM